MPSLTILCDAPGADDARACARVLAAAGFQTHVLERAAFPTGDSLPALLHAVAARGDVAVVVISATPSAQSWLAPELAMESLYPTFALLIARGAPVPACVARTLGARASTDPGALPRLVSNILERAGAARG